MIVYVCCFGGVTSCFFCRNIQKANDEEIYIDHIDNIALDYEDLSQRYKYIIAYGPVAYLCKEDIEDKRLHQFISHIFICPQARYLISSIIGVLQSYQMTISSLDMKLFGCVDLKCLVKTIKQEINNIHKK